MLHTWALQNTLVPILFCGFSATYCISAATDVRTARTPAFECTTHGYISEAFKPNKVEPTMHWYVLVNLWVAGIVRLPSQCTHGSRCSLVIIAWRYGNVKREHNLAISINSCGDSFERLVQAYCRDNKVWCGR